MADEDIAVWLRTSPDSAAAHLLKGRIAVAKNQLPEAAEVLRRLQAIGAPRDEVRLLHALIAAKAGRATEAIPTLKQAFDEAGRKPDMQIDELLARAYLETFDLKNAAAVLDRWASDFPDDAKPYLWRAEIDSRDGGQVGAVENDYREALRRDPSLARARLGLADELRKAHRTAEAATEYDAYLALEPKNAAAHLGAGRNLLEHGDQAAAIRHLNRAIELDPTSAEPHIELANAIFRRGDWSAALASIDRAIAVDPHDVTARNLRGLALTRLGRVDEAKAEQATAAKLRDDLKRLNEARTGLIARPHDRASQLVIARWMFDHGHDEEGARWAKQILSEHRDDPDAARLLADYHRRRGESGLANFYSLMTPPDPASSQRKQPGG
jgi:tetratricopeptide (TPR) repeat protein